MRSRSATSLVPWLACIAVAAACGAPASSSPPATPIRGQHTSSMAQSADGSRLYVVNPDADSVSELDLVSGTLVREILLGATRPAPDAQGAFAPAIMPRAAALSADQRTLFVTGERAGRLYAVDLASGAITSVVVGSEPVGLVVSPDGGSVFVAVTQDNRVVRVDARTMTVSGGVNVASEPWALALSPNGGVLFASHFLAASVTAIDADSMTVLRSMSVPDVQARGDKRLAHGQARGLYDVAMRPGTSELWVAYSLLATDTAQPDLDFQSTAFAAVSVLTSEGIPTAMMSVNARDVAGVNGAFADVVSGPRAVAFPNDGSFALLISQNSEDVLAIDTSTHVETSLLRPLPGHQPEGILVSPDGARAYVHERNTNDVFTITVDTTSGPPRLRLAGSPISTLAGEDPMPPQIRYGQRLFYSANSDEHPITTNHWVACATCHMEGRSDAVTWRFVEGPRDTPTNAGGMLGTGFLFRTADRARVQDYFRTINDEQGGHYQPTIPLLAADLDAIATYVNKGIPFPIPPTTDTELVARGSALFQAKGCATCHSGPLFTDSAAGNPALDLGGTVLLHDVHTCSTGPFADVAHQDIEGHPRLPCAFDTPSLRGAAATPPYLHDGSAASLEDAVKRMPTSNGAPLTEDEAAAVAEFVRSL